MSKMTKFFKHPITNKVLFFWNLLAVLLNMGIMFNGQMTFEKRKSAALWGLANAVLMYFIYDDAFPKKKKTNDK